jgi:hypothetical protein
MNSGSRTGADELAGAPHELGELGAAGAAGGAVGADVAGFMPCGQGVGVEKPGIDGIDG